MVDEFRLSQIGGSALSDAHTTYALVQLTDGLRSLRDLAGSLPPYMHRAITLARLIGCLAVESNRHYPLLGLALNTTQLM